MSLKIQLPHQSILRTKASLAPPLLLSIGVSLMTLTGCQTSTGIQQPSSQSVVRQPTSSNIPTTQPPKTTAPSKSKSIVTTYPKSTQTTAPSPSAPASPSSPANNTFSNDPNSTDYDAPIDYGNAADNTNTDTANNDTDNTNIASIGILPPASTAPVRDTRTPQQILIDQARRHSNTGAKSTSSIQNGDNIPAFRKLMNTGVSQLKQGQLSAAQATFTRAQRLAPQSSSVYFYLGQVALKQKQYIKAEAMARRGLVVAQSASRKQALWQLILQSAQLRGNQSVVKEAQTQLAQ